MLYFAVKTLIESGHEHVYNAVEKPLQLAQTAAVLEVKSPSLLLFPCYLLNLAGKCIIIGFSVFLSQRCLLVVLDDYRKGRFCMVLWVSVSVFFS